MNGQVPPTIQIYLTQIAYIRYVITNVIRGVRLMLRVNRRAWTKEHSLTAANWRQEKETHRFPWTVPLSFSTQPACVICEVLQSEVMRLENRITIVLNK